MLTRTRRATLLAFLGLVVPACVGDRMNKPGSTSIEEESGIPFNDDVKPIAAIVEASNQPESIGAFLSRCDQSIKAWNNLLLTAQSSEERRRARLLEEDLMRVTHKRRAELIQELESGPLNNRIVAAAALGFTRDAEAQSPLIAALDSDSEEVLSSALIGLWLLGRGDTPLERMCELMQSHQSEDVRANATLCIMNLSQAGAKADCVLPSARIGLLDPAPAVRSQSILLLANLKDAASVQAISDRLYDETPLVASAASKGLAYMGLKIPEQRGVAARALVQAWIKSIEPLKGQIFRAMVELSGMNYGKDEKEWTLWATRLP